MKIDLDYLRDHYAHLSDEALQDVDTVGLVDAARDVYDQEFQRRNLRMTSPGVLAGDPSGATEAEDAEWLEDAAEIYSHYAASANATSPEAEDARRALTAAGIPCHLELHEEEAPQERNPGPSFRWRLLVPGKLNQQAASILERDIFNPDFEEQWRSHLEMLSDEEVQQMRPEVAFCGLFDKIERIKRVWREELSARGF